MKRSRRKFSKLALVIGLQVQLVLMIAANSEAFHFWPSSRASPSKSTRHNQDHRTTTPAARHRLDNAPEATASTTPAPIELHFEINAEPPETQQRQQQQQQLVDESSFEMKTLNGSLILEDLVKQFEQNFRQKRRGAEPADEVDNSLRYEAAVSSRNVSGERHLAEFVDAPTTEISLELLHATSAASLKPSPNDTLVDSLQADQEDRHIQYDPVSSHLATNELESGPSNETEASVRNFTAAILQAAARGDSRNFTLEPIRVQSERVVFNNSLDDFRRRLDAGAPEDEDASQVVYSNSTLLVMPAAGSQKAEEQQQQARQKSHQARSMSSSGAQRAPQHSKPPYASYNQFHHSRSETGGPPLQLVTTNNHHHDRTTFGDLAHGNSSIQHQRVTNEVSAQGASQPDNNNKLQAASELLQSISRISSHLAGEAAGQQEESNGTAAITTTSSTTSTSTTSTTPRPPAMADVIAHSYEFLRERQQAQQQQELERMAPKLAPINDPIDLSPIASTSASVEQQPSAPHSSSNGAHQMAASEISPNHFYFSQAPFADLEESRSPAPTPESNNNNNNNNNNFQRFQNDRYSYGGAAFDTANLFNQQLSEPANQLFLIRGEGQLGSPLKQLSSRATTSTDRPARVPADFRPHDMDEATPALSSHPLGSASASSLSLPFGPQLNRKTLELVSNQIQHADQSQAAVHQHKERSPNSLEQHQRGGGGSHAASLINVTAPMVLPLSATEAMEASLGADPAARQMMHQVGGGSSMGLAGSGLQDLHGSHSHQRPLISGSSYRPANYLGPQRDERHREPAYSLPANSFSPRPHNSASPSGYTMATSGAEPTFAGPAPSLDGGSQAGAATTSAPGLLSADERERLRLRDLSRTSPGGQQASGFRLPFTHNAYLPNPDNLVPSGAAWMHTTSLPTPSSYLSGATSGRFSANGGSSTQAPPVAQTASNSSSAAQAIRNSPAAGQTPMRNSTASQNQDASSSNQAGLAATTNGFLTGSVSANSSSSSSSEGAQMGAGSQQHQPPQTSSQVQVGSSAANGQPGAAPAPPPAPPANKRVFNLTRVEHISAECSNDLIRTVIIFNGTFKGIIYSSGYVRDPSCMYVNGTGKTRYDFSIRLNQCGTLGRQELHPSSRPNELNRRDQVMWNTLSIQYNPIVEQEWDEHFRVSCEYGGDFWKTISFSPFNVETNTGSPVVFTVDPPQCQMEILKGHGMVGPRQEAVSGPVTVGDPLTLLIHMKSEKAGYDILVKNCIAHNGGQQKMQLIDNSGCVVNERFISPFRGTYNDNDLKHVTLYSYLKAFRFTGSPVLYLECEVHMCQSACPPQMCYWRTLSKRSINETRLLAGGEPLLDTFTESQFDLSDGSDELDDDVRSIRFNLTASTTTTTTTTTSTEPSTRRSARRGRNLRHATSGGENATKPAGETLSDRVSLFQALEVRQEREPENLPEAFAYDQPGRRSADERQLEPAMILCYRRAEVFAFLFTVASVLLAAISLTVGCCFRASSLKRQARHQAAKSKRHQQQQQFVSQALSLTSANLGYAPLTSYLSPSPSTGSSGGSGGSGGSSASSPSSYAGSSQPSPTSGAQYYSPEAADAAAASGAKQSGQRQAACAAGSLGALIKQQQQLKLAEAAARKSACQTQFIG